MIRIIEKCSSHLRRARLTWLRPRFPWIVLGLALVCVALVGCGKEPSAKVMHGSVTCSGESVPIGNVTFVPIDGTAARICAAPVVDGQYRIEAKGGVPLGKYRIEVNARRKTGRTIQGNNGIEQTMIDEEVRTGPAAYAGDKSPLTTEVRADSDGQLDIAIPPQ